MNRISKPRIVDFLRLCDKNKWVHPRIRFASVRSKPELIRDILAHFIISESNNLICIMTQTPNRRVPVIFYDLSEKKYMIDGQYREFTKESRQRPTFEIRRQATTISFESFRLSSDSHAKRTISDVSSLFREPGTDAPPAETS